MRLLKRIFGWNSGQAALINQKRITPKFTRKEEPSEEDPLLEVIDEAVADAEKPETIVK